ncbi:hypothetical protein BP5796_12028 [Coleophoma crateriformis]|uniref:Uncharacterized protein n=1 Tax=Coleophoma crateriformis TaxID=565419 RepID=A0A3D8QCC5_9HELO|nr:hypothetical protein BP5796_12028 [Coleophoma crateriformis]
MPTKDATKPYISAPRFNDGSDDVYDQEEASMIEKYSAPNSRKATGNLRSMAAVVGVLLIASLAGSAIQLWWAIFDAQDLDAVSVNHTSEYWSPIMDDIKIRYESVRFNGSFIHKSIYQQSAGPEVDKAWSDLGIDCKRNQDHYLTIADSASPYCDCPRSPRNGSWHGPVIGQEYDTPNPSVECRLLP